VSYFIPEHHTQGYTEDAAPGPSYTGAWGDMTPLGIAIPTLGVIQTLSPRKPQAHSTASTSAADGWGSVVKWGLIVGGVFGAYFIYRNLVVQTKVTRSVFSGAREGLMGGVE
jgi:hypothetical protein